MLWGMKPETLRRAAAKAMEQKKSLVFQDRLKGLLRGVAINWELKVEN